MYKHQEVVEAADINCPDPFIQSDIDELDEFYNKLEVLNYFRSDIPNKYIKELIRYRKKTKLNPEFYSTREPMKLNEVKDKITPVDFTLPATVEFDSVRLSFEIN